MKISGRFMWQSGQIVPISDPAQDPRIAASNAANPQASKGGYEGVGTAEHPGPEGQQSYGTTLPQDGSQGDGSQGAGGNFVPPDMGSFLGIYGLPPDIQAKVDNIFASTGDVNEATALAMAYIRGTPWYAQTYPGIQEGIAKGVISNEADYRAYLNQVNNLTQQYQGRQVGSDELAGYLRSGFAPEHIGRLFAGQAYIGANRNDIQYASGAMDSQGQFNSSELTALGNENAGIDSELGQRIQNRLNLAQQRIRVAFSGSLATPGLSTANGRLQATTLGGGTTPNDVAA